MSRSKREVTSSKGRRAAAARGASDGWFAARPSGTEALYKIYAESFTSEVHVDRIIVEAQIIVRNALGRAPR